ncbi:hypothetical protein PIB30_045789 [Stylosanthes scabra]|uniref:KIB1-4 beta-propeller domain-containing protein n=1 Tax=Stylosanthes scabra TaxID=79078 RepID=A0ABU6YGW4_9FABA|nr:hypothetical protein [Stylosanthes scabra]
MGDHVDQWANIHEDMLNDEIAKRIYSYDDYLRLRLVCKQWSFKLPKIPTAGNNVPWLLLPIGGTIDDDETTLDTTRLEEKEIYHLTLPVPPELQYNLIRGSCHGWLIIVSMYEGTIRMLNPLTKVCLDLPPISTLPDVILNGDKLSFYHGAGMGTEDAIVSNRFIVWKVVMNSAPVDANGNANDFTAVALYAASLAFYKSSKGRWLKLNSRHGRFFRDVIFFEGKIYAIDDYGHLVEFDTMATKAGPVERIHETPPPYDIVPSNQVTNKKYLIGCADGSLLIVVRHLQNLLGYGGERYYETFHFDIYELKKNAEAWSRITCLGDYALVIGFNASLQMPAANGKKNRIYFTDNFVQEQALVEHYYHNIGIFNLEDDSYQTVLEDDIFFSPPVWIFP